MPYSLLQPAWLLGCDGGCRNLKSGNAVGGRENLGFRMQGTHIPTRLHDTQDSQPNINAFGKVPKTNKWKTFLGNAWFSNIEPPIPPSIPELIGNWTYAPPAFHLAVGGSGGDSMIRISDRRQISCMNDCCGCLCFLHLTLLSLPHSGLWPHAPRCNCLVTRPVFSVSLHADLGPTNSSDEIEFRKRALTKMHYWNSEAWNVWIQHG